MRIAVTGGAGYIGSTLMGRLLSEGHTVISIDNLTRGDYAPLRDLEGSISLVVGDIRDLSLLREAFQDLDAIIHLAAIPGLKMCEENPEEAISVNVYGTNQVLRGAVEMGVQHIIFASSAAVYGSPRYLPVDEGHPLNPLNLYGVTKMAGEKLVEAYHENHGLDATILRFGNVYGVGLYTRWDTVIPKFVRQGLRGEPLTIYGDGHSSRDFVHVEDVIEAIILALRHGGGFEIYNIGGESMEVGRVAEIVCEEIEAATGRRIKVVHLPPRIGETRHMEYDTTRIRDRLNYKPRWSVRRGVRQLIEYALKRGGAFEA